MDNLKTEYPDDTVMMPMTLEELSLLAMQYPGKGWDAMVLRAKQMVAQKQAEIKLRSLPE